jgi:hypothetical protein
MRQVLETFITWSVMAHFADRVLLDLVIKLVAIKAGG